MYNTEEYLINRSRDNLVDFCSEELEKIINGRFSHELLSYKVRRRLTSYGVIKKHGNKYIVTELGKKLLDKKEKHP